MPISINRTLLFCRISNIYGKWILIAAGVRYVIISAQCMHNMPHVRFRGTVHCTSPMCFQLRPGRLAQQRYLIANFKLKSRTRTYTLDKRHVFSFAQPHFRTKPERARSLDSFPKYLLDKTELDTFTARARDVCEGSVGQLGSARLAAYNIIPCERFN